MSATAQSTTAATDCDFLKSEVARLKAENAFLRKNAAKTSSAVGTAAVPAASLGKQMADKVEFSLVKCEGNSKTQTVTVELLLTNTGATRPLQFAQVSAVDTGGDEYKTFDIYVGSNALRNDLPTGVPVKARFLIPKVLPSTKSFARLACPVYTLNEPGRETVVEFRTVPITWK